MKKQALLLAMLVLAMCVGARADDPAPPTLISGVSVIVNDNVITYGEITAAIERNLDVVARMYANDPERMQEEARRIRAQQVEVLVERKLILHEFTATGYVTNVLEATIDDQVKKNIQRTFSGDRAVLIKTLQAEGETYESYRNQVRENFIVDWMSYHNVDEPHKILISPLKIERYYNEHPEKFRVAAQVKLRMIVIDQTADAPPGQARATAEEVLRKIDGGVPFAEMAQERSSGSQRSQGGDYGWVDRSFFKPELAKVAFSLAPGQHSGVVELPEACYIIQVEDARPSHLRTLAETRREIEQTLKAEEKTRLRTAWIERLKKKSFIQYY
jgi:parvulin-like peptidyl-prolyl isomerase